MNRPPNYPTDFPTDMDRTPPDDWPAEMVDAAEFAARASMPETSLITKAARGLIARPMKSGNRLGWKRAYVDAVVAVRTAQLAAADAAVATGDH